MDQKDIPNGMYCYEILSESEDGISRSTRACPYFKWLPPDKHGDIDAYCEFLKEKDIILLNDACKICDINKDIE